MNRTKSIENENYDEKDEKTETKTDLDSDAKKVCTKKKLLCEIDNLI